MAKRPEAEQQVTSYCSGVLDGSIPACELVKLCVRRHLRDLEAAEAGSLFYWDAKAVQLVVDFFLLLKHSKGRWAGQPFALSPWQVFIVGMIYGWKRRETKTRRFSTGYIEIPRKNGKSTFLAGLELFGLVADGEAGAEVYTAATKRDQAKIIHAEATRMVKASPDLKAMVRVFKNNLSVDATASKCEPLGRDSDTMDGLNPSMIAIDELHAHKDSGVWDVLDTATGSRDQPLLIAITTAGFNQTAICFDMHKYSLSLLNETNHDDSFFCFISSVDEADRQHWEDSKDERTAWNDREAWIRANPNWGVSVLPAEFVNQARKAAGIPSQRPAFMTKRLNLWISSGQSWLPIEAWDACGVEAIDPVSFSARRCWGGLDLASRTDIASFVLAFDRDDGGLDIRCWSWIPEATAIDRSKSDGAPYLAWADDADSGVVLTPGNVIDYKAIAHQIAEAGRLYDLEFICADRWGLEFLRQQLEEGGAMIVEFGQGFASMSPAIKEAERLIIGGLMNHGGNPVLRWAVQNIVTVTDPADNIKFSKKASGDKIDPAVAMVMAVGGAMAGRGVKASDFYESNELEFA